MRTSLACFFLLITACLNAQYKIRFILKEQTAIRHDTIYVAGSFNNWDSTANCKYPLKPYGTNEKMIVLKLNRGVIEYKFHRGNWSKEERNYNGDLVNNHVANIIGRVLLNLFNNAFYAVNEKKKTADKTYQPTVSIQTKKINKKVEIIVSDKGNGIPQNIIDKIFQPFFTTKPTGQGTGLGLSLAYDVIKAHNGEIRVETKEGEGSKFIITIPFV
jgi:signal transduction histidine kinase